MPYVNLKLVKGQVSASQKEQIIEGLTDLIVKLMRRDRKMTVITIDELDRDQWIIGGKPINRTDGEIKAVSLVNIKVSKGTTNPVEMANMMKESKDLMAEILGNCEEANYFIIDELNPDAWGFDGIPMTIRNKMDN